MTGGYSIKRRIVERPTIPQHFKNPMIATIGQRFDKLRNRFKIAPLVAEYEILDPLARQDLVIDVKPSSLHLNSVARQSDQPLDIIGLVVTR